MDNYFTNQVDNLIEQSEWLVTEYSTQQYQCSFINTDKTVLFAFSDNHEILIEGFINKNDKNIHFTQGSFVELLMNSNYSPIEQNTRLYEKMHTMFSSMTMTHQLSAQKISEENSFRPHAKY